MKLEDVRLWDGVIPDMDMVSKNGEIKEEWIPTLTPYILEGEEIRPTIIVCPGGAFQFRAGHEGEPIAKWFNQLGINAFVLNYRVEPFSPFTSVKDAVRSIKYVRYHAKKYHVDSEKIGMIGFSAGGFLTAFVGTHFDNGSVDASSREAQIMSAFLLESNSNDPIDQVSTQLNAIILCYAATAPFSKENLPPDVFPETGITVDEMMDFTSNHKYVTTKTPPTFMWVTANDDWNFQKPNILFAQALSNFDMPFDFHIFSKGSHGLGLGDTVPMVSAWPKLCENWLKGLNFIE